MLVHRRSCSQHTRFMSTRMSAETVSTTQELLGLSEDSVLAVLSVAPSGSPQTTRLAAQRHVLGTRRQASGATGSWHWSRPRSQAASCSRFRTFSPQCRQFRALWRTSRVPEPKAMSRTRRNRLHRQPGGDWLPTDLVRTIRSVSTNQ
jgi:hypothetical protein